MLFRKFLILFMLVFVLSGCATYKFQKSKDKTPGYLVSYDNKPIIEYTVGQDKSLPNLETAKERFNRRRASVEYYYKKMGLIESKWKQNFWNFPTMALELVGGVLRWPFTAVSDYRYNHNPAYKERVDRLEEQREELEKARVKSLQEKLNEYVKKDLAKESGQEKPAEVEVIKTSPEVAPLEKPEEPRVEEAAVESLPAIEAAKVNPPSVEEEKPVESKVLTKTAQPEQAQTDALVAVISAQPLKGFSPLKVKFSAQKSRSKGGKIVSYYWDFGDGDSSFKKNPENTYWSTSYGERDFTVTLTVKDERRNASSASTTISVSTR